MGLLLILSRKRHVRYVILFTSKNVLAYIAYVNMLVGLRCLFKGCLRPYARISVSTSEGCRYWVGYDHFSPNLCDSYDLLSLYILSTYFVLTPCLRGLRFMPRRYSQVSRGQIEDVPVQAASSIYSRSAAESELCVMLLGLR